MSQDALKQALSKTVQGIQQNPVLSQVVFECGAADRRLIFGHFPGSTVSGRVSGAPFWPVAR